MRYISHLDFIRLLYRSLRRADLPYVLTAGYNRHPKISFGKALKVGQEGVMEARFFLSRELGLEEFNKRMQKQLVEGIKIIEINYGK